ncbi:putative MFS family arabinose efflux permease [Pseudomonas sp. PvR086]|jgi:predicted MFS family arabinose efflux permease|uniref:MFS transporter n=1 Tax=Pseudomonas TaxID=286 RepID=UPI000B34D075|nr:MULTISPECIES: MFS transporter [Pseudomonas]MBD9607741.1 MFS transporter [Pseudomonas sp. PDM08]MDR7105841.1 putative MFS family arabinose efflux permease [Pseudomonas frederiksbergensis]PMY50600.1 MFS transporter [Pseudomonas sp. FW305-53]PMY85852.1 MFS transporter [Pseudomonas sp. FW303-C2]PMY91132.1 MFS transporter [Pseudomonas sp. FW305-62]
MKPDHPLSGAVVLLFAVACGLAVGNVYYAQPLLDAMAEAFAMDPATIGIIITLTQIGYGVGLLLLVPLGDLLNRRRLIVLQTLLSALALLMIALAPSSTWLLLGMALTGLLAVVTQVLVAYAATLAIPAQRGRVVGVITSGIVVGILLARTVAGGMADLAGWRSIYLLSAGLTLVMALLLFRVLPRHEDARPDSAYGALIGSVFTLFKEEPVLRQRAILALLTFASAMVLWTPLVLPLSAPPLSLSHTEIGLFGLAGAAGALAAARAGHLADRGLGQWTSGLSLLLMLASWLPIALTQSSLWALLLGVITLDLGLQAVHVTSQSMIYSVRPEAQSRLTAGYMLFYSIGSALGSIGSTAMYAWGGWIAVCWLGAGISAVALIYWWLTLATKTPNTCGEGACSRSAAQQA